MQPRYEQFIRERQLHYERQPCHCPLVHPCVQVAPFAKCLAMNQLKDMVVRMREARAKTHRLQCRHYVP